jgi:hypothetical protein
MMISGTRSRCRAAADGTSTSRIRIFRTAIARVRPVDDVQMHFGEEGVVAIEPA